MKKILISLLLFISIGIFAQDSPGVYTIKNAKINTSYSDFGTAFLGDNKVVFASPKEGITFNREEYNSQPFLDLYIGEVTDDGQLIKKQKLPGDINTKFHEGMVSFSKDMKTVYFSANGKIKKVKRKNKKEVKTKRTITIQLFKASIDEKGEWGNLEMLPFNSDDFSTGHPVLNRDDTKLYFVSDRPESLGKTDIFVVDIYEDGTYGQPVNLGPKINTAEREMFPFIGKDNVLYFSSDGIPGYGELDVFASKIFDNTQSTPINLEAPVNSDKDDFAYIIDDGKHKGYFSSNREGGKGDDDIYAFTASPPIHIECQQEITGVVKNIDTQQLIPNVQIMLFDENGIKLQSFLSDENDASFSFMQSCNTTYKVKGYLEGYLIGELDIKTVNDLNAEPIEIVMHMGVDPTEEIDAIVDAAEVQKLESQTETKSEDKVAESEMTEGDQIEDNSTEVIAEVAAAEIAADSEKQQENSDIATGVAAAEIATDSDNKRENIEIEVVSTIGTQQDERNESTEEDGLNINTIYFDFDKHNIRYDARLQMDKLVKILREYPQMKIKVNAHTDIRGTRKYNASLADKRADETVQYLITNGIEADRVTGMGFGETQLAEKCTKVKPCNSFQHQLNRRSEFRILKNGTEDFVLRSKNIRNSMDADNNSFTSNSGLFTNYNFYENNEVYTVQIGAFHGDVQTKKYSKLTNLFHHKYEDGFSRYFAGIFETSSEARSYMKIMKKRGFNDAFVVGLKGENRY